jgi:hypothetical protein
MSLTQKMIDPATSFVLNPTLQDVLKGVDLLVGALTEPPVQAELPPYGYVKQFAEPQKLTAVDYRHIVTGYLITWHNQLVQVRMENRTLAEQVRSESARAATADNRAGELEHERNLLLAKLEQKTEELSNALHTIAQVVPPAPVWSPAVAS